MMEGAPEVIPDESPDSLRESESTKLLSDTQKASQGEDTNHTIDTLSNTKQWIILIALLSLQFLTISIDTFLLPFFTEKALEKGLHEIQIGVVFCTYNLSRFVGATVLVSWIVQFRAHRVYMVGGTIISASCIAFGLCALTPDGLWFFSLCLLIRLAAGMGSGMLTTTCTSVLLKSTSFTPSTIMASMESMVGAGYASGPAIGAFLYKVMGYTGCFIPLAVLTLLSTVVSVQVLPDMKPENSGKSFLRLMLIPGILLIFVSVAALKVASHGTSIFFAHFLTSQTGVDIYITGITFAVAAIGYCPTSLLSARVANKMGWLWSQMLFGWVVIAVTFILLPPSPLLDFVFHGRRFAALSITMFIIEYSAEAAIYVPPLQTSLDIVKSYGYDAEHHETYAMVSGMIHGGISLGAGISPILAGVITQLVGYDWFVTTSALLCLVMFLLTTLYLITVKLRQSTRAETMH